MTRKVDGAAVLGRVGRRGVMVMIIVILGSLTAGRYWWSRAPDLQGRPSQVHPDSLYIAPGHLDFGSVWESSTFSWVLAVENRGEQDVDVEELAASCSCTSVEPRSSVIPAHQTRDVRLTIDLTQGRRSGLSDSAGEPFEMQIWPRIRGGAVSRDGGHWVLRGTVRPLVSLRPTGVDLGDVSELSATATKRVVQVNSARPLRSLKVISDSNQLLSQLKRVSGGSASVYELTVTVPPNPRLGALEQDVLVEAELEAGGVVTKAVHVAGRVIKDCQSTPSDAALGVRLVGETAQESVTLYSLTRQRLEIVEQSAQGEGLSLENGPTAGPGGVSVQVRQRVVKAGQQTGKLVFKVRAGRGTVIDVVVPVSYHGLEP